MAYSSASQTMCRDPVMYRVQLLTLARNLTISNTIHYLNTKIIMELSISETHNLKPEFRGGIMLIIPVPYLQIRSKYT
jgi:hypothetical protein